MTAAPTVVALLEPFVKGWPEHDDERAGVFPLSEVLTGRFDSDVHFTAYTAAVERRHTTGSLARAEEAGVQMVAAVFDVDGPDHQGDEAWWQSKRDSILRLLEDHSGGFAYRTRGGFRLVFELLSPAPILTAANAERWTREYLAWCNLLEDVYSLSPDRKCKEWQRLYRAPHATRDGVFLDLETIGDPSKLGCWFVTPEELEQYADVIADSAEKTPKNSESLDSGVISHAPSVSLRASAAELLAKHWPPSGHRADARLALVGACVREGWPRTDAASFVKAVHAHLPDRGDVNDAVLDGMVDNAIGRLARGESVAGWTALSGYVSPAVVKTVRDWTTLADPEGAAQFEALVKAKPAKAETGDELGIQWGGWDKPQQPPVYLLEGLIPEAKVVTFFAEGGSVKTWSALSLAIAVATGQPWLGAYPVKRGRALVLDYEDGAYEFHRRVRYLTGGIDVPELGYRYGGPQIDSKEYWVELAEYVQKHGIALVIFDSISASMPGDADENSSAFAQGVKYAGRFTETGCTVIFIHHANKSGGIRGHSAVRDQSDVVFKFEPVSETDDVKRMRMVCDKPGPQKRPLPVNVELTDAGLFTFTDEEADVARNVETEKDLEQAVYLYIESHQPVAKMALIRDAMKTKKSRVDDIVHGLIEEGKVAKTDEGYIADDDDKRRARVLEQLDSSIVFLTQAELARHAFVSTLLIDRMRLEGIICQSGEKRWMRVR